MLGRRSSGIANHLRTVRPSSQTRGMGMNNRQRRAAKARQRTANNRRTRPTGPPSPPAEVRLEEVREALDQLLYGDPRSWAWPIHIEQFDKAPARLQQQAIDTRFDEYVGLLVSAGWTPTDLAEMNRRRSREPATSYLLAAVARETARHDPARVAPEWTAQLSGVRPATGCATWCEDHGFAWPAARDALVELLTLLVGLPRLEPVLAPPGHWQPSPATARGVDERILAKVRALLAKAESTEFDQEAETLTAKAQQLMTEHSIERALAESNEPRRPTPAVRRMWLDAPYVDAKAALANQVAVNNRCHCVLTGPLGFVTLV